MVANTSGKVVQLSRPFLQHLLHLEDFHLNNKYCFRSRREEGRGDQRHRNRCDLVRHSVRHRLLVAAYFIYSCRLHSRDFYQRTVNHFDQGELAVQGVSNILAKIPLAFSFSTKFHQATRRTSSFWCLHS